MEKLKKFINENYLTLATYEEKVFDSIEHCKATNYRYMNYYESGQNVEFNESVNMDNAVSY